MSPVILVVAVISLGALAALVLLAAIGRRRSRAAVIIRSDVCQQHLYLFQGGHLSESSVEAAKSSLRPLLTRAQPSKVRGDDLLQPGLRFAAQVRALVELGTREAGNILERQLQRRLSDDALEQSWYWLDLAHGLRRMKRSACLPALFCCFGSGDFPLAQFLAAEIACFAGFQKYLSRPRTSAGRTALRVLHQTLVGLRSGVQPNVVAMARLGEAIECAWDHRSEHVDPLTVRIFAEALRLVQRSGHAERAFGENDAERKLFRSQIARIADLEEGLKDYLEESQEGLLCELERAPARNQADLLRALTDVRADTAAVVVPMLNSRQIAPVDLAIESLAWSRQVALGDWLCSQARRWGIPRGRRSGDKVERARYLAILKSLRRFPSEKSEGILVAAASCGDAEIQTVALRSLGWWEPVRRADVRHCLQRARFAPDAEVQRSAHAALARLGERSALHWFRQRFAAENAHAVHHAIQCVADEGILLLWPDLDRLADAEDNDVAYHACEALEQMRESCIASVPPR
jgi:hypothetical protein